MDQREVVPERMDNPALNPRDHRAALADLARLNRWSRGAGALWDVLRREDSSVPLRVFDLACGSGDLLVNLAHRAARTGRSMTFAGSDLSPVAVAAAEERAAREGLAVKFHECDVLRSPLPEYDVLMTSLFLHHLPDEQAVELLRRMAAAAQRLVVVLDLNRSAISLALVTLGCRLLTRSPVVRYDGPASVRAAFTRSEAKVLADRAGMHDCEIVPWRPCRWRLTWRKPS